MHWVFLVLVVSALGTRLRGTMQFTTQGPNDDEDSDSDIVSGSQLKREFEALSADEHHSTNSIESQLAKMQETGFSQPVLPKPRLTKQVITEHIHVSSSDVAVNHTQAKCRKVRVLECEQITPSVSITPSVTPSPSPAPLLFPPSWENPDYSKLGKVVPNTVAIQEVARPISASDRTFIDHLIEQKETHIYRKKHFHLVPNVLIAQNISDQINMLELASEERGPLADLVTTATALSATQYPGEQQLIENIQKTVENPHELNAPTMQLVDAAASSLYDYLQTISKQGGLRSRGTRPFIDQVIEAGSELTRFDDQIERIKMNKCGEWLGSDCLEPSPSPNEGDLAATADGENGQGNSQENDEENEVFYSPSSSPAPQRIEVPRENFEQNAPPPDGALMFAPSRSATASISTGYSSSSTPTQTVSPSFTPTQSTSETPTASRTPSQSQSPTQSISVSITPSISVSVSITPSQGSSPTPTPTKTPSPSSSSSTTGTPSPSTTASVTVSASVSSSASVTLSATTSPSLSKTPSSSPTSSVVLSPTSTRTPSQTPSRTATSSPSPTPTPSAEPEDCCDFTNLPEHKQIFDEGVKRGYETGFDSGIKSAFRDIQRLGIDPSTLDLDSLGRFNKE